MVRKVISNHLQPIHSIRFIETGGLFVGLYGTRSSTTLDYSTKDTEGQTCA
jgi:hypothetical protein